MLPRPLILTGLLGAAVAGPMAISNAPKDWKAPWGSLSGARPDANTVAAATWQPNLPVAPPATELHNNGSLIYRSPAPLGGAVVSISEALRMDVNPQWVYARWARKSTGLADPELFGIRTPLVTGNQMADLAGALSYYFDADGVAQRLRFHGRTADTRHIVALAVQRFGMQRQLGQPGEQLYQRRTRRGVESQLRTRPEAVLWGTSPHSSFMVDMEVNRPGSGRLVPPLEPKLELPESTPVASPVSANQVAQTQPPTAADAGADTPDDASSSQDESLLGLRPGRLPPRRWPH